MKPRDLCLPLLLGAVAVSGCGGPLSTYRVAAPPGVSTSPEAVHTLSSGATTGTLRVIVVGSEKRPAAQQAAALYLHVQLRLENRNDDVIWSADPHEQRITIGPDVVTPAFSKAGANGPLLSVARGKQGTLDLYYPLPAGDPEQVGVAWQIRRGGEVLAAVTTAFDRMGRPDGNVGNIGMPE
jgi:hypothetical protein